MKVYKKDKRYFIFLESNEESEMEYFVPDGWNTSTIGDIEELNSGSKKVIFSKDRNDSLFGQLDENHIMIKFRICNSLKENAIHSLESQIVSGQKEGHAFFYEYASLKILKKISFSLNGTIKNIMDRIHREFYRSIDSIIDNLKSNGDVLNYIQDQDNLELFDLHPSQFTIKIVDLLSMSAKDVHNRILASSKFGGLELKLRDGGSLFIKESSFSSSETPGHNKILVLGHNGMLGHMVVKRLSLEHDVSIIDHRFPSDEFKKYVSNYHGEYIINCISSNDSGSLNFSVNEDLPIWLEKNAKCKIIYPGMGSDDGIDPYSGAKRNVRKFVLEQAKKTKIISSFLIGPEIGEGKKLLNWFTNNTSERISGYSNEIWNGITTLEWSEICNRIIKDWDSFGRINVVEGERVSKFHLLHLLSEEFGINKTIIPVIKGRDRSISGGIKSHSIRKQVKDLIKFYYTGKILDSKL
jgi:dTDP-4-dehydrorhamnose reductase